MADITASASVQSAAASTSSDSILLHTQALNSLSRCKAMLLANEPMYLFAQNALAEAQQAIEALWALDCANAAR